MSKLIFVLSLISTMFLLSLKVEAQEPSAETAIKDSTYRAIAPASAKKKSASKIQEASSDLQKSLSENNELKIAKNYEALAEEFIAKNQLNKGEEYLKKSLESYTKLNSKIDITRVSRSLAKLQESQKKYDAAIKSYDMAGSVAEESKSQQINSNDANRLRSASNPAAQSIYLDSNIELLDKETQAEEISDAYMQKAEISLKKDNKEEAIVNYNKALRVAKVKPESTIEINNKISEVYASENQFDKAITIHKNLLEDARNKQDADTELEQLEALANIYFKKEDNQKAISNLQLAYNLAVKQGKTFEAKNILSKLLNYYKSTGKDQETIALYEDFFTKLDQLIATDSSLIDSKVFEVTEEKIKQLEKEKALKDELISNKNTFNYFLIAAIIVLLILFYFIVKALYQNKIANKKIALQSLRREMNPHFIFNSLNSVNQFISQNNELEANKYMTSYSNLMRNTMENSNKDFITLSNEIEHLTKYLELEHMRFKDKFEFKVYVDESLDTETTFVPNMIIQPHLENAIWHGLRYRKNKGLLKLSFEAKNGIVTVIIDDNGIGLTKSQELKTQNQKVYQSRGLTNTKERISLLNKLYKKHISFEMAEKTNPETGVIIKIMLPLIHNIG